MALGRKGGNARAKRLTKKRRSEIAKLAAFARWNKPVPPVDGAAPNQATKGDRSNG